jgi:hypothetical protein
VIATARRLRLTTRPSDLYIRPMQRILVLAALALCAACASASGGSGEGPPPSFVPSTAESRATRVIDVREGLPHAQAMRILTDALAQHFTVEVTDPRAGFAMTAWQSGLVREGVPDLRYRTRLTAKFVGEEWRQLQVRGEANWARGEEWEVGFDAVQLDSVVADLRTKLGRKP